MLIFVFTLVQGQRKKDKDLFDTSNYINQTDRIEFRDDKLGNDFMIINGYEDGLLVVKQTPDRHSGGYGWELYKLDTALQSEWVKLRIIPLTHTFMGWDYSDEYFYLLFSSAQYRPEEFTIYKIDSSNGEVEAIELTTVFPIELSHFEVVNNTVVFGGQTRMKPAVLTFNLDERKPRVIPGVYEQNSHILDIFINDEQGVFTVAMMEKTTQNNFTVSVRTFTTDNILVQNNILQPGERRNLIDAAPTDFSTGFQYVTGAFSLKSRDYSQGLYLSKFRNGRQQFIKYYNYGDLTNFFDYMKKNRRKRVKDRISKKKSKGKNKKFNYRLLVHEIIPRGNQYIMVGEAYYPRYSSYRSTMMPYTPNMYGSNYNQTRVYNNVIGYKYTHAIVVSFDQNGNILWDHSFPIDDVFLPHLEELVAVNIFGDKIELSYLEENEIRSKVISGNEVIEGETFTPVSLDSEDDEFVRRDPEVEGLEKWYGDVLYAYGQQEIQHGSGGFLKNRRKVFYINKVRHNLENLSN